MERLFQVKLQRRVKVYLLSRWLELARTSGPASLGLYWPTEESPLLHSADQR